MANVSWSLVQAIQRNDENEFKRLCNEHEFDMLGMLKNRPTLDSLVKESTENRKFILKNCLQKDKIRLTLYFEEVIRNLK